MENKNSRATLNTLQSRTALAAIRKNTLPLTTEKEIRFAAKTVYKELITQFEKDFPIEIRKALIAFILSHVGTKAVETEQITAIQYLQIIAHEKRMIEDVLQDFGAFGDLYEILIRLAMVKNLNLINWHMLTVKALNKCDVISKRYGKVEIGHNGKTLSFGTLYDYMSGEYDSIVYGVFSPDDKEQVYKLCDDGQIIQAIEYVTSYSVYWADKYQFQKDMDNLSRGKGITKKGANIQVVYNSSKYGVFINAIESGKFKAMNEN